MDPVLLDSDMLSEVLKQKNAVVAIHAVDYLAAHGQFAFSAVSRFEVLRGHKELNAVKQLARFLVFCQHSLVLPLNDVIFDLAADLWVTARKHGHPREDADLLIAATALVHARVLATGNVAHFRWISGLRIVDWRQP